MIQHTSHPRRGMLATWPCIREVCSSYRDRRDGGARCGSRDGPTGQCNIAASVVACPVIGTVLERYHLNAHAVESAGYLHFSFVSLSSEYVTF